MSLRDWNAAGFGIMVAVLSWDAAAQFFGYGHWFGSDHSIPASLGLATLLPASLLGAALGRIAFGTSRR